MIERGVKMHIQRLELVNQWQPIQYAAEIGNAAIISILIHHGAKIDDGSYFDTPLAIASSHGHHDAVSFLLQRGAKDREEAYSYGCFCCSAEYQVRNPVSGDCFCDLLVYGKLDYNMTEVLNNSSSPYKTISEITPPVEILRLLLQVGFYYQEGKSVTGKGLVTQLIWKLHAEKVHDGNSDLMNTLFLALGYEDV